MLDTARGRGLPPSAHRSHGGPRPHAIPHPTDFEVGVATRTFSDAAQSSGSVARPTARRRSCDVSVRSGPIRRAFLRVASIAGVSLVLGMYLSTGCRRPPAGRSFGNIYEFGFEDGTKGVLQNYVGGAADGVVLSNDGALGTHSLSNTVTASTADVGFDIQYIYPNWAAGTLRDVWVRFALKWTPRPSGGIQKLFRVKTQPGGVGAGTLVGNGTLNSDRFSWVWDGLASGGGTDLTNAPTQSSIQGQWHWWEFHLRFPANAPAHVDIYFDDVLVLSQDSPVVNSSGITGLASPLDTYDVGGLLLGGTVNALPSGGPITFDTRLDQVGVSTVQMHIPQQSSTP